jgi:hypothetical protein
MVEMHKQSKNITEKRLEWLRMKMTRNKMVEGLINQYMYYLRQFPGKMNLRLIPFNEEY